MIGFSETMRKEAVSAAKDAIFEKHVVKIMEQDGLNRRDAKFQAWLEGADGLSKRN